jgi:hypothetical protein
MGAGILSECRRCGTDFEEWNGEFSESVYDSDFSDTLCFVEDEEAEVV